MSQAESLAVQRAGLTEHEYALICESLGRAPNPLELGMFGVLWSEHCSYKHSRSLLRRFPTEGPQVLQGPGENAGAVDIGDGLAAVMKIESHNHPSAVEPFQGAATGVGGILRDIFAMGARPIALMDALCFGAPDAPRTPYLTGGVVAGIAFYGNCVGVPTVGGSMFFDQHYNGNPLVNVLCLGIASSDHIVRAKAQGAHNRVLLVGSATGRDGIAGASFASVELSEANEEKRPAVQVGNPFLGKLVLEACLEALGQPGVIAVQDLGAAGLTGAATEVAAHGGSGIDIDIAKVSRRESGMSPYEVMLSESQERMLFVVEPAGEAQLLSLFQRWGLRADTIGEVTDDGLVRVRDGDDVVAELPAEFLSEGAPRYQGAAFLQPAGPPVADEPPFEAPSDLGDVLRRLIANPNLCSRRPVFEQYDHMVQINTVVPPGDGAAVLRVKGTSKGLVLGLGLNPRVCALDPWTGGAVAVAEACRNVVCGGGRPIALTDCLNFGDPERPEVWWALVGAIEGIRDACLALDVPIISGNVSLYNESEGEPILPTPIVGALGLIDNIERHAAALVEAGDMLWLVGPPEGWLAGSEYAAAIHGWSGLVSPRIDLDMERRVQACVRELIATGAVRRATDVADGGLAVTLAELALESNIGIRCDTDWMSAPRPDISLFGEAPSRIIIAAAVENSTHIEAAAHRWNTPLVQLGSAAGREISFGSLLSVPLESLQGPWLRALDELLKG
ncbi:MAG: phosphoribosylformylglycinamidine synthase subunit PurL [Chloroflexi bacterium]|nr:phosphoribosylformylglycinamidine synthase subunit PurL [Chloroflexota bacterium]